MFRSIMVALDGTPFGEYALPLAVSLAKRVGASLNLVHVHVPALNRDADLLLEERKYLEKVTGTVRTRVPELKVSTALLEGAQAESVAEALVLHMEQNPTDLVVMNSHARGGLSRWWLGNVADDLVHRTSVPLLVTPDIEDDPGWQPEPRLRHILIALDGTPLAENVLPTALNLGQSVGAEFTLLRVLEPAPVPVVDPVLVPAAGYDAGLMDRLRADAEDYLTRTMRRLRGDHAGLRVGTRVLLDAEPAEAICDYLRHHARRPGDETAEGADSPVDVVALATHGREGLARLLLGSVSDRVLQHTPVPLLLKRVPQARAEAVIDDSQPPDV